MATAQAYTQSNTNTYTQPRAKYVTDKAFEDILGIQGRGFISSDTANNWRDDIQFFLEKKVLKSFEIQFEFPNGKMAGLKYLLKDDNSIYADEESGGDDFWDLPNGTSVSLLVSWKSESHRDSIQDELVKRGYIRGGNSIVGEFTHERDYSKGGYGFQKHKIGF